jgi:glycerol kinase
VSVLVVDVGTSSVRAAIVSADGAVAHMRQRQLVRSTPAPGFVEFDAGAMAVAVLEVATSSLEAARSANRASTVEAVAITNQRASSVVWDRATGEPVGPGIGWQDLRTAAMCLQLREQGIRLAPNQSATKAAMLLDLADPQRRRDLCFGTVDTWVAWTLSGGALHVTDATNAAVTGLFRDDCGGWDDATLDALGLPSLLMPDVVDSSGVVGEARALSGAPPLAGIAGDQQASLVGQGCVHAGLAKVTCGTGGILDLCVGSTRPFASGDVEITNRGPSGTYPVIAWRAQGRDTFAVEAIMLSAGACVEWLRDDLCVLASAAESDEVAAACAESGGVWFVPALSGLGTPVWDFGARGTLLGLTRATTRGEVVRAVLEGVAHRCADLVEAAEADSGLRIESLKVDGGMSANRSFAQALADAAGRPVEVSALTEATTLGAAFLAGTAVGVWPDLARAAAAVPPARVVEPGRALDRGRWREALERSRRTVPELSAIEF